MSDLTGQWIPCPECAEVFAARLAAVETDLRQARDELRRWEDLCAGKDRALSNEIKAKTEARAERDEAQAALRDARKGAVQGVLELMRESSLPYGEWEPDTIAPHTNGYSMWFVGRENFLDGDVTNGQMLGTAPLSAESIVDRIDARAALPVAARPEADA